MNTLLFVVLSEVCADKKAMIGKTTLDQQIQYKSLCMYLVQYFFL